MTEESKHIEKLVEIQGFIEGCINGFRAAFHEMADTDETIPAWDRCKRFSDALEAEETLRRHLNDLSPDYLTAQQLRLRDALNRLVNPALQQHVKRLTAETNDAKQVFESFIASGQLN